jgi:hypothetical protein
LGFASQLFKNWVALTAGVWFSGERLPKQAQGPGFQLQHCKKKKSILHFKSEILHKKHIMSQVPVAHTYNPSYSGGRDQDHSSRPARANSSREILSWKNPSQKIGLVEWLKVKALSSNSSTTKTKTRDGQFKKWRTVPH